MRHHILLFLFVGISNLAYNQTYKVEEITYEFVVKEISGVNSKYNDFSPVIYDGQLLLTSGRESNLVLQGENNWSKTGFLNVFAASYKGDLTAETKFNPPILFSKDIANNNHSGPICFSVTGDTIFYTQLEEIKRRQKKERRPQLYMAVKDGNSWTNPQKLPFCQEDYSYGHPSWDKNRLELYFASDMPGGKGGKDLYKVRLSSNGWDQPFNLAEFNTPNDELFPFIIENDLFYSSDKPGGKGGLDIYWKVLGHEQKLLPADFNSADDDHGIFILPGQSKGFYSKRSEGIDNIYFLEITRSVLITNELAGQFTYRNLDQTYASDLDIQLIHEDDIVMQMNTDSTGKFAFRNLPYENYTIKLVGEEDVELAIFDKNGKVVTNLLQDANGLFQYKKINNTEAGTLTMLEDMNEGKWLDYTDITGQFVYEKIQGQYGDSITVMLVDEDGNIIFTEVSDNRGNFTFKNIPTDQNYTIATEVVEDDLFLFIYDQNGNVYTQLKANQKGEFVYKKIKPDYANNLQYLAENDDVFELETMTITGNFNYKKLEGQFNEGLTVYLYSEDGILLDSAVTDQFGHFRFSSLDPDQSYLFKMKEDDPNFVMDEFNLHVEDRFGNVLADLYRAEDGYFRYKQIETIANKDLAHKDEKDEDFNFTQNQVNNNNQTTNNNQTNNNNQTTNYVGGDSFSIFFDLNSSYTNFKDNAQLNQLISDLRSNGKKIQINAFADSRSTDQYNMWLSERRGLRVKEYLMKKGIAESRIEISAFGESQSVNNCGDGNSCSDEEYAKNRRVDLKIEK
ncbi:MAG: OmpA family protein [Crocinitomicaceae bacterium]